MTQHAQSPHHTPELRCRRHRARLLRATHKAETIFLCASEVRFAGSRQASDTAAPAFAFFSLFALVSRLFPPLDALRLRLSLATTLDLDIDVRDVQVGPDCRGTNAVHAERARIYCATAAIDE